MTRTDSEGQARKRESGEFSFHRGSLSLDFVGTLGFRGSPDPKERLPDRAALRRWLFKARVVQRPQVKVSESDLAVAILLREAIAKCAAAILSRTQPADDALLTINRVALNCALGVRKLDSSLNGKWTSSDPVGFGLGLVADDAIIVFSSQRDRLTRCALVACGAWLLSRARNEKRRWCSMETCGNRAKVAAFRARHA